MLLHLKRFILLKKSCVYNVSLVLGCLTAITSTPCFQVYRLFIKHFKTDIITVSLEIPKCTKFHCICSMYNKSHDDLLYSGDSFHYRQSFMLQHHMMKFSTPDRDYDYSFMNCAQELGSGWWFNDCYRFI